jgi:methyltransferase (TIGR00027 family)
MPIEHVSDTARWVAYYRAMETDRPDAIFRDPFARRLAGAQGEAIVNTLKRGRSAAWAMVVRTSLFDEIIARAIAKDGVDMVVNLAAGLDARPWRMPLPPTLRWVDVDLPGILSYKTDALRDEPTTCEYEAVHADLTDAAVRHTLLARLGAEGRRTLVATEGLLIYLAESDVGALASDLALQPSFASWLIDIASPRVLKYMTKSWGRSVSSGNAPFLFAPANGAAFFLPFGWREKEFRSSIHEAHRLRREMPLGWLWRFMDQFQSPARREQTRRFSGVVLLEPAAGARSQ